MKEGGEKEGRPDEGMSFEGDEYVRSYHSRTQSFAVSCQKVLSEYLCLENIPGYCTYFKLINQQQPGMSATQRQIQYLVMREIDSVFCLTIGSNKQKIVFKEQFVC